MEIEGLKVANEVLVKVKAKKKAKKNYELQ